MANNPYYNKVEYGGNVLIDLTADTVEANKMLSGITAHSKSGAPITGNIASKSAQTYTPTTTNQIIASGQYLSGTQTISGDANLVAGNIKKNVSIFGVTGNYEGSGGGTTSDSDVVEFARKMVDRSLTEVRAEDLIALGVTSIGNSAFETCSNIWGISVPSGVTRINYDAFSDCQNLQSLVLPSTLTTTGSAFTRNTPLTNLVFPPNMTRGPANFEGMTWLHSLVLPDFYDGSLGGSGLFTFENCWSLSWIDLPQISTVPFLNRVFAQYPFRETSLETLIIRCDNPSWLGVDNTTFVVEGDVSDNPTYFPNDGSFKIYVPSSTLSAYQTEASDPNSPWYPYRNVIYAIPTYSELYLTLTSSDLTQTLYFQQSAVSAVTIDWGDSSATEQDSTNTSVALSHTYASAGDYVVILTCASGQTWTPGTPSDGIGILGGDKNGGNTPALTKAILRNGFSFLVDSTQSNSGGYAFAGCTSLEMVRFPKDMVIGSTANPVLNLPSYTFFACSSLYDFDIPTTLTSIGTDVIGFAAGSTFDGTSSITGISLPGTCTSIGQYCFAGSNLTSAVIPYGTSSINGLFYNCESLSSVILPDTITDLYIDSFNGCTHLSSLRLPARLEKVGIRCFNGCTNLQSLNFPETVSVLSYTTLGPVDEPVFDGSGITSLTFSSLTPPTIMSKTFNGLPQAYIIYVPSASLTAYQQAQYWSDVASHIQAIPE